MDIDSDEEVKKQKQQPQNLYNFDIPQVVTLLQGILSGDNNKIKEATKILRLYTKQDECIAPMLYIIANSPEVQLRQISAVLLTRNMRTLFSNLSDKNKKEEIKKVLLERYFLETSKPVRESIGRLISTVANTNEMQDSGWNELMAVIDQKTNPQSALLEREKGIALISYLVEITGDEINNKYEKYLEFFKANLQDPERTIRVQTLKTLLAMFDYFDRTQMKTVDMFQALLNTMLEVLNDCLKHSEEDIAHLFFEVFSTVAEGKSKFLNEELHKIVIYIFSDSFIFNKSISQVLKEAGLDFISNLAYHHRAVLVKDNNVLNKILVCLVNISSQPIPKPEMSDDTETLQDIALWLLETLSLRLPKKNVYKTLTKEIDRLIHSNDENLMNTGFLILAGISEGCSHLMKTDLEEVILKNWILFGLGQTSPKVRGAAITSLGYLSEFLVPEIVDYHEMIIPILLKGFNEEDLKVKEKSVFSMDIFCENMDREIIPYLQILMPSLAGLIMSPTASYFMRKMAIMSIGSCVTSAQQHFRPYLADCVDFMSKIIHSKSESDFLTVQAAAIQSLGKIFSVFYLDDSQIYNQYIIPSMETIYKMMVNIDDSEVREASLSFFYLLAGPMGQEFGTVLDKITEFAFKIAESQKGISYDDDDDSELSLDSESDDESTEHKNANEVKVHMNFLDEKAAAIKAIGEFAQACPIQFKPHFEKAIKIIEKTYNYFYENIRIQSVICFKNIGEAMVKSINNGVLPKYERGKLGVRFPKEIHDFLVYSLYNKFMDLIIDDESIEVKVNAVENLCALINSLGPAFIEPHYRETIKYVRKRLRRHMDGFKKTYLGIRTVIHNDKDVDDDNDSGDGSEDDEDSEDRMMMFEYISDLIPALSKSMGMQFKPFFIKMYTPLILLTQKSAELDEKIQSLGTMVQTFKHMPNLIGLFQDKFIRVFEEMPNEKDDELSRNVAFGAGVFCLKNTPAMKVHFPRILKILSRIFEESEQLETKENALAALARLIMASPEDVPVEECLKKIFAHTPFKGDLEEEKTLMKMLIFLCQKNEALIAKYLEESMMLLLDGIINSMRYKLSQKVLVTSAQLIKAVCNNNSVIKQKVESQVLILPDRNKNRVIDLLK